MKATADPVLTISIDIAQLVAVVRRHAKLTPKAVRAITDDFAELFQASRILVQSGALARKTEASADAVLGTQAAADLVGVSRPYLVARIEAGDIALHQQAGNQRRVLQSAVLAWHRREQTHRRKALVQLGAHLDQEAFPR
jgi:excisionase family DNA binding protein